LLVAVDPSREGHEQHLQGVEFGSHWPILLYLTPDRVPDTGPAEYSDTTGWLLMLPPWIPGKPPTVLTEAPIARWEQVAAFGEVSGHGISTKASNTPR
jgi:hypothetical protein